MMTNPRRVCSPAAYAMPTDPPWSEHEGGARAERRHRWAVRVRCQLSTPPPPPSPCPPPVLWDRCMGWRRGQGTFPAMSARAASKRKSKSLKSLKSPDSALTSPWFPSPPQLRQVHSPKARDAALRRRQRLCDARGRRHPRSQARVAAGGRCGRPSGAYT